MTKLSLFLALAQAVIIQGLPAQHVKRASRGIDERAITLSSGLDITTSYSSTLQTLQTATVTASPSLTGTVVATLPSNGMTQDPLAPSVTQPLSSLAPIESTLAPASTGSGQAAANIFVPLAADKPPSQFTSRSDHPVKKDKIVDGDVPLSTNKFCSNLFLGTQQSSVWAQPYSLNWAKGTGNTWGMVVNHINQSQLSWAPDTQFFAAPIGLQPIVLSAAELRSSTSLSVESLTAFSAYANLAPSAGAGPILSLPLVQGMGFATALYNGATPELNSGTAFSSLDYIEQLNGNIYKYRIALNDTAHWLLYATPVASLGAPPFKLVNSSLIQGPSDYIGMIQVAKNPSNTTGEAIHDSTAGVYAVNATITASVSGNQGSYTLSWAKAGIKERKPLMFALPHQVESFDDTTKAAMTDLSLNTISKGLAKAVIADSITMLETSLPTEIGFGPWVPSSNTADDTSDSGLSPALPNFAVSAVNSAGALELGQDFNKQTRLDSMYYSGKGLAKFAGVIYTLQSLSSNTELAAAGLVKLKDAFNVFVNNTQPLPLVYDSVWKGVVSSGTYQLGNTGLDFGNTLYNDHHFHYGYFLYTAAVIGYLDPSWLTQGTNKLWVNTLVRDFANPSTTDPYFPFQRSFDWYNGHSWAKGLFDSGDGKDQESSSEDTFSSYALKMWGRVSGDANMEARGNLQLAVLKRTLRNYFLLSKDNTVQPQRFVDKHRVSGILFENKIDHSTYFGNEAQYVEGIHMIPLNPSTPYTRPASFVQEEWDQYFSGGRADNVTGGWKGILYANLASIDPATSYAFFSQPGFDISMLDGGASLTWYLAYSAVLQGGSGKEANATEAVGNADAGSGSDAGSGATTQEDVAQTGDQTQADDGTSEEGQQQQDGDSSDPSTDNKGELSDVEGRSSDSDDDDNEQSGWDTDNDGTTTGTEKDAGSGDEGEASDTEDQSADPTSTDTGDQDPVEQTDENAS
ncbi:glycoside hydrolase family 81 protein [Lophiostoma macrostomum CBS 122681]|uniref:glucan endo-1,3-beta-D-glucosidase n=1 Tax=Lophiostoma macrostomum CBS 122681 TaxID=1314788 RepID=A0A6A6TNR3_9PLEO|nr:glycoside hydrolase family 81 protein [Lophiostoma macrostomum CBS 122681]